MNSSQWNINKSRIKIEKEVEEWYNSSENLKFQVYWKKTPTVNLTVES